VDALDELRTYVKTLPEGRITDAKVKLLISHCWDLLEGSSDHSMNMFKVHRAEDLMFNPPATILFNIERHGQTVQGSIYASVQKWQINLIEGTATSNPFDEEKRIVGKRDAPLKVNPIAEKVVNDIVNLNKKSEFLFNILFQKRYNKQQLRAEGGLEKSLKNYSQVKGGTERLFIMFMRKKNLLDQQLCQILKHGKNTL